MSDCRSSSSRKTSAFQLPFIYIYYYYYHCSTADAADAALHRAPMVVQSRRHDKQKLSTPQELWLVLKDNLLLMYNSPKVTI